MAILLVCKTFIKSDSIAQTHTIKSHFILKLNTFVLNLLVICMLNNLMQINLIRTSTRWNCIRFRRTTGYYYVIFLLCQLVLCRTHHFWKIFCFIPFGKWQIRFLFSNFSNVPISLNNILIWNHFYKEKNETTQHK